MSTELEFTNKYLEESIGLKTSSKFSFKCLGLASAVKPDTLSFLDDLNFLDQVSENPNIIAVICTKELAFRIVNNKALIICDDPRYWFYKLLNHMALECQEETPTIIHKSAIIHERAFIDSKNVEIGKRTVIGPNVSILRDVRIGDDCIIQAGSVIGSEGYEYKRTSKGILRVLHDGKVIIGDEVEIGANTAIDKGFSFRDTIIRDRVKIDNLVHVAHGVQIGEGSFIIASAMLGGSLTLGKNTWIGPNATVSNGLSIGSEATVSLGAVVTKSVGIDQRVSGNFAINHDLFLRILKDQLK